MNEFVQDWTLSRKQSLRTSESRHWIRAISWLCAVLIGWLLCESIVRVLVPRPIFYSTWFTPAVHQLDSQHGFVFAGGYDGAMRHSDGVWMEPLELDRFGFRRAAGEFKSASPSSDDTSKQRNLVMLGGASMAFSFGLSDRESLHHQTASSMSSRATIQVLAWPGFTLGQDLLKLDRFLGSKKFDGAIVFAYSEADYQPVSSLEVTPGGTSIAMDQGVVLPNDPIAARVGWPYYRSVVIAGAARWWTSMAAAIGIGSLGEGKPGPSRETEPEQSTDIPSDSQNVRVAMPPPLLVAQKLRERGIDNVWIVALPHQLTKQGPDSLASWSGNDVSVVDLRGLAERADMDWIAGGHYGPNSARIISEQLAREIEFSESESSLVREES
jgi:hypothetical protein